MKEMKTVKEVCELTGLNRKLLYLYDKEGIVKPSAYQNGGYEGLAKNAERGACKGYAFKNYG